MEQVAEVAVPSRLLLDWATVRVLWGRDVVRFFRQRSRVVGALAQPLLFWAVMGSGFGRSFQAEGMTGLSYTHYFFAGVVAMVLLFSAIFATITVIEDRREGFLQSVLAGPGSRLSVVAGKCLGSSTIALLQAGLFLGFAPLAGVAWATVSLPILVAALVLTALFLCGLGFTLAWWINSSTGYHAVMSVILIPMWILSGAMFPVSGAGPVIGALMQVNPMRFSVDALRQALYGEAAVAAVTRGTVSTNLAALMGLAAFVLALAAWRVSRRD
jgi:ABC-2 type transport system permease protein